MTTAGHPKGECCGNANKSKDDCCGTSNNSGGGGTVASGTYGLGFVGALIYFIQHADSFGEGSLGVLKAIVWPAIFVYKVFESMGA